MIEVKVSGLLPDKKSGMHVLLLRVPNTPKHFPIWIGPAEASSIALVLRGQSFERPLTHDLLQHVIHGLGATVSRVVITSIQDNTFFARIFLSRDNEIVSIDARPSDSVALAVRVNCPIFLTEDLMREQQDHLVEIEEETGEWGAGGPSAAAAEEIVASNESLEELMRSVEKGLGPSGPPAPPEDDEDSEED